MIDLVFPNQLLSDLTSAMRQSKDETAAIALALPVFFEDAQDWRLLVQEIHAVPDDAYDHRSPYQVRMDSKFQLSCEARARTNGWSVVYCHSHPHVSERPSFSSLDDMTESALAAYLSTRIPNVPHVSLLVGAEELNCRRLGTCDAVRVLEVGRNLVTAFDVNGANGFGPLYDRQILAFGEAGQQALQGLRVAVIGLGGTGSAVVQQLAYLGVRRYVLIDRDIVDVTNLNRMAGACWSDVGKTKVSVARRQIETICGDVIIDAIVSDVVDNACSSNLVQADVIFCCTDSHASRNLLNTISYQYYIPCIDMGVVLTPRNDRSVGIAGRVNMVSPGLPCLTCLNVLNPDEIRRELLDSEHQNADPYFSQAVGITQPAVMSLTSTVASLAVTMFLGAVAGMPATARGQFYDGVLGRVRAIGMKPYPECVVCSSKAGVFGRGDTVPLPERLQ